MAYIIAPEPAPYLRHTSDNDHNQSTTNNSPTSTESDQPAMPWRRSRRNIQRPIRFKDYLSPDSVLGTSSLSSDENHHHKIKRILAKKIEGPPVLYLVQIKPRGNLLKILFGYRRKICQLEPYNIFANDHHLRFNVCEDCLAIYPSVRIVSPTICV